MKFEFISPCCISSVILRCCRHVNKKSFKISNVIQQRILYKSGSSNCTLNIAILDDWCTQRTWNKKTMKTLLFNFLHLNTFSAYSTPENWNVYRKSRGKSADVKKLAVSRHATGFFYLQLCFLKTQLAKMLQDWCQIILHLKQVEIHFELKLNEKYLYIIKTFWARGLGGKYEIWIMQQYWNSGKDILAWHHTLHSL